MTPPGDETRAKIARLSPSRRVPVLHIDGLVIWDSLAIAEFLHERAPEDIDRARRVGAKGYITKDAIAASLVDAILAAAR